MSGRVAIRGWRRAILPTLLALALQAPGPAYAAPSPEASAGAVPPDAAAATVPASLADTDQVLIRWRQTGTAAAAASSSARVSAVSKAAGHGARFVRTSGSGASVYRLDAKLGKDATRTLAALRRLTGVATVEPDLWMTADALPNDPYGAQLWGLLGPANGSAFGIDALSAWPTTRGAGVVVAVIDTGLVSHPDLAGQSVAGYDMITDVTTANDGDGRDADPSDPGDWCGGKNSTWHGTHVAGTIAAVANNAVGVFGGAPDARFQPVRVLGKCGGYSSDIADAMRWASGGTVAGVPENTTPAKVLNLSLSGSYPTCPTEYVSAIADARSRGSLVVVAAGNYGIDAASYTPANCTDALTVAATDNAGHRASFSNYGSLVDIAGPGTTILSTLNSGTTTPGQPIYANYQGTSMAAPHVAVSAALVASAFPSLGPDAIAAVLEFTSTAFPADTAAQPCATVGCGAGIVNAGRAVSRLVAGPPVVGAVTASAFSAPGGNVTVAATAVDPDGVASAQARVDGGGWVPMTAAHGAFGGTFERLAGTVTAPSSEGSHTVCVRATDPGAQRSDGAACATFTVDAGPPSVSGASATPTAAGPGQPVLVGASASDGIAVASAQVRVDSGPWMAATAADGAFGGTSESTASAVGLEAVSVSAGAHSCARLADGRSYCWGANSLGELGDGTTVDRPIPQPVELAGVVAAATGTTYSCFLLSDATVRCAGDNSFAQLGDGTTTNRSTPAAVSGLAGVAAIYPGESHSCALMTDTTVRCWGWNAYGQLGDGTTTGRLSPVAVAGLSGVAALALGSDHTCALMADATVRCWGRNDAGQLGNGTTVNSFSPVTVSGLSNVEALGAGQSYACALRGGLVFCWGGPLNGQLGDGAGVNHYTPNQVVNVSGATALAVATDHSCALLGDATVTCWGANGTGQLGDGTTTDNATPVAVEGLAGATAVSAGAGSSCAVLGDGSIECWGGNSAGGLGDGTTADRSTPVRVAGTGALAVGSHLACVRATDTAGNTSNGSACASIDVGAVPSSPLRARATAGDGSALVSWQAPLHTGSGPISGYAVTSTPGGLGCSTTGAPSCTVSGLSNGIAYAFSVTAANGAGQSEPSVSTAPLTLDSAVGRPTGVTAVRGDGQATVSWQAPSSGATITRYEVSASAGNLGCSTTGALSCVVHGTANGTAYTFTVVAYSGSTAGPASDPSNRLDPLPAARLVLVPDSNPPQAGTATQLFVTAMDMYDHQVPGYAGTVHFTSTDARASLPADYTFTPGDVDGHTFGATFGTAGTQSVSVQDDSLPALTAQAQVQVAPGAVTELAVSASPGPWTAGQAGSVTVRARDAYGNATAYVGTVHFTATDPHATLPADYTFGSADAGVRSFGVTFTTAGSQAVRVRDTTTSTITGRVTVAVNAGSPSALEVTPSATWAAGSPGSVAVRALDAYGNTAVYTGTVHLTASDPRAVLAPDYTFGAGDAGVHVFGATLITAGVQGIRARDTVATSITGRASVTVNAGPTTALVVTPSSGSWTAGVPGTLSVRAVDAFGNTTAYRGTVHFTSTDPQAILPADYAFVAADGGVHMFGATFRTAGAQAIRARDTVAPATTGRATVTVIPGAASALLVSAAPATWTAGVAGTLTVRAVDAYGNTAPYAGAVHFTSTDARATLPADYTFKSGDAGVHSFTATLATAGGQAIRARDTVTSTITGRITIAVVAR